MKRTIKGITYIRDPLFAPIRANHIEWLRGIEASAFYESPLEDVGVNAKRLDILISMGLVREVETSEWSRGLHYVLTEKGKSAIQKKPNK